MNTPHNDWFDVEPPIMRQLSKNNQLRLRSDPKLLKHTMIVQDIPKLAAISIENQVDLLISSTTCHLGELIIHPLLHASFLRAKVRASTSL